MKLFSALIFFLFLCIGKIDAQNMYEEWNTEFSCRPQLCDSNFGCIIYGGNVVCDEAGNSYTYVQEVFTTSILKFNSQGLLVWRIDSLPLTAFPWELSAISYSNGYLYYLSYNGLNKYDTEGNLIWSLAYGFETWSSTTQVLFDNQDNILINWTGESAGYINGYADSIHVTKVASDGVLQWDISYIDSFVSETMGFIIDSNGNTYLSYNSEFYVGPSDGYTQYLKKISPQGNEIWSYNYSTYNCERPFSIGITSAGNIWADLNYDNSSNTIMTFDTNGILISTKAMGNDYTPFSYVNNYCYSVIYPSNGIEVVRLDSNYSKKNSFTIANEYLITSIYHAGYYYVFSIPADSQNQIKIYKLDSLLHPLQSIIHTYPNSLPLSYGAVYTYAAIDTSNNIHLFSNEWGTSAEMYMICQTCKPNIAGNIFYDANQNCVKDSGEMGIVNRMLELTPGAIYTFTDSMGNFGFLRPPGDYVISLILPLYWQQDTCAYYNTVHLDSASILPVTDTVGIYYQSNIRDMTISIAAGYAQPGFQQYISVSYANAGTVTDSGIVAVTIDSAFSFVQSFPLYDSISGLTYFWKFNNMLMGENREIGIITDLPGWVGVYYPYQYSCMVEPIDSDQTPANNVDTTVGYTIGSFDPNEKTCSVKNANNMGNLTDSSTLVYQIQFQNTGTDTAKKVLVVDTIDNNLDISTLTTIQASSKYQVSFLGNQIIEWAFDNILLPDTHDNQALSMAFIKYTVKPKTNLLTGATISNSASIYFDYNTPVKTNTTLNYYEINLGLPSLNDYLSSVKVIPNPYTSIGRIQFDHPTGKAVTAVFYDFTGKKIVEKKYNDDFNMIIPSDLFSSGIYFVDIKQNNLRIATAKFILQR